MHKACRQTIALALAASCILMPLGCSKTGVAVSGGGTDVSNASVAGRIVNVDGVGETNVQVRLIPSSYLPSLGDSLQGGPAILTDTTDAEGKYNFPGVKQGSYSIQAVHLTKRTRMLEQNISVPDKGVQTIRADSLRKPGRLAVILRPGRAYSTDGYLFVPGTEISKLVTTTSSCLVIDSVPAGIISAICYSDPSNPQAYSPVSNAIDIEPGKTSAAGTAFCLLVTGNSAALSVTDSLIADELQSIGITVSTKPDSAVTASDTSGKDIILISPTATSSKLSSLITVSVSLIVCQTRLYPLLNFTGVSLGADYMIYDKQNVDYTDSTHQNVMEMRDVAHPISPDIAGTQVFLNFPQYIVWGIPTLKAKNVASVYGDITKDIIFTYEAGEMMVSVITPGRRVGLSYHEDIFPSLDSLGWTLFDNSAYWSLKIR
jgi:hypothetical protein